MANTNFDTINAQLAALPGYREAISRANEYQRGQVARQFAAAHGIQVPSGAVDAQGRFYDPNADHWYSDPRILGPAAVGAATGIGLLTMAPAAAGAAGAGGLLPSAQAVPTSVAMNAVPASIASQAASAGIPLGGLTASAGGAGAAAGGAAAAEGGRSLGRQILDHVLTPQGLATLAGTIGGIATGGGGGNIEDDPNAKALIEMALRRQQRTDPLHESVVNLANAMLPTAYQRKG